MKSTLDIVDDIWKVLDVSPLKDEITGSIYKHTRPAGSLLEDVVINTLPITGNQIQEAVANVNIHVPDIEVNVNSVIDKQPNHLRLKALCFIALTSLSDNWDGDYNFDVQQQTLLKDENGGDHYINIRIDFYNINI